jgi:hypothetical protein
VHATSGLVEQPPLPLAHSSMSVHVTPSPVKPAAHEHVRDPGVLAQTAFALHPPLPDEHSLTSVHADRSALSS